MKFVRYADLHSRVRYLHGLDPQKEAQAHNAEGQIRDALTNLHKLGIDLVLAELEEGDDVGVELQEWPKMLYHDGVPEGRVARNEEHAKTFGEGWREHPRAEPPQPGADEHDDEVAKLGIGANPQTAGSTDYGPMIGLPHRPKQQFDDSAANKARLDNHAGGSETTTETGDGE